MRNPGWGPDGVILLQGRKGTRGRVRDSLLSHYFKSEKAPGPLSSHGLFLPPPVQPDSPYYPFPFVFLSPISPVPRNDAAESFNNSIFCYWFKVETALFLVPRFSLVSISPVLKVSFLTHSLRCFPIHLTKMNYLETSATLFSKLRERTAESSTHYTYLHFLQ